MWFEGAMCNNWPPEELLTVAALSQLAQLDMQLAVRLGARSETGQAKASWLARQHANLSRCICNIIHSRL